MDQKTGSISVEGENSTITFERHLPHPTEKVWTAITDPVKRVAWFGILHMYFEYKEENPNVAAQLFVSS